MDTKFINKSICFLGDSITEHGHYLYDIRSYFHNKPEKVFVHNCGTGGNRAIMAQYILDKEIEVYNPDFVVISFGVNDMGVWLYDSNKTVTERLLEKRKARDDEYYLVSNDFNIDCWSENVSPENLKNPMRVLSASYKNYGLESAPKVNISGNCLCSIIGTVEIGNEILSIYKGADGENYLVSKIHDGKNIIKPKQEFIDSFWDTLDDFERVLLNRDSDPIYKATFETPFVLLCLFLLSLIVCIPYIL